MAASDVYKRQPQRPRLFPGYEMRSVVLPVRHELLYLERALQNITAALQQRPNASEHVFHAVDPLDRVVPGRLRVAQPSDDRGVVQHADAVARLRASKKVHRSVDEKRRDQMLKPGNGWSNAFV